MGNNGDIFVGGSFESRVWDGHTYVSLNNIAYFDGEFVFIHLSFEYRSSLPNVLLGILLHYWWWSGCDIIYVAETVSWLPLSGGHVACNSNDTPRYV